MKKLFLTQCFADEQPEPGKPVYDYRVEKVVGSITPVVFSRLPRDAADAYCNDLEWIVTIT